MKVTRLPLRLCPECGEELDACTGVADPTGPPSPGDLTMCGYCAALMVFDADLCPVKPDASRLAELESDPAWQVMKGLQKRWLKRLNREKH